MPPPTITLGEFDQLPIIEYNITCSDLANVYRYLQVSHARPPQFSQPIWGKIKHRVKERHLTLETYHEALEEYSTDYRILPEIHHVTADTAAEIRHWLREKYIFLKEPATSP